MQKKKNIEMDEIIGKNKLAKFNQNEMKIKKNKNHILKEYLYMIPHRFFCK